VLTDLGNEAYHGPCAEKGDPPHRYTFTVYALSVEKLDVGAGHQTERQACDEDFLYFRYSILAW